MLSPSSKPSLSATAGTGTGTASRSPPYLSNPPPPPVQPSRAGLALAPGLAAPADLNKLLERVGSQTPVNMFQQPQQQQQQTPSQQREKEWDSAQIQLPYGSQFSGQQQSYPLDSSSSSDAGAPATSPRTVLGTLTGARKQSLPADDPFGLDAMDLSSLAFALGGNTRTTPISSSADYGGDQMQRLSFGAREGRATPQNPQGPYFTEPQSSGPGIYGTSTGSGRETSIPTPYLSATAASASMGNMGAVGYGMGMGMSRHHLPPQQHHHIPYPTPVPTPFPRYAESRSIIRWPHLSFRFMFLGDPLKRQLSDLVARCRQNGVAVHSPYRDKSDPAACLMVEGSSNAVDMCAQAISNFFLAALDRMCSEEVMLSAQQRERLTSSELTR